MPTINMLSEETLCMILNIIDNVNDLAQLRLVCKRWNQHAERIMFSKQITLKSNSQALVLYGHLFKNPSYTKLVRHIHFDPNYDDKSSWLMGALLKLAFTPNTLKLTGVAKEEDRVFDFIADISNEPGAKFDKLVSLPHQPDDFTSAYSNALIHFRHTLTSITIHLTRVLPGDAFWNFVDRLGEFKNLKAFDFRASVERFSDVERILKGCKQVQSLTLSPCMNESFDSNEISTWMAANVKPVYSLTSLRIIDECYGDLLEYLTYKYPSVEKIDIDAEYCRFSYNDIDSFKSNMNRVLQSIKRIPKKRVDFIITHEEIFMDVLRYFRSINCTLVIKEVLADNDILLAIEGI